MKTFLVGERPRDAAFSPDGTSAYVSSELGQVLSVVDVATHSVVARLSLGYNDSVKPVGVLVSANGSMIYVANGRGNTVSVIDAESLKILKTIAVGSRVWG